MKLSVSLIPDDVAFLDIYAADKSLKSRSAAVQEAVRLLRLEVLKPDYEEAFTEWDESEDKELWDSVSGDGLDDEPE